MPSIRKLLFYLCPVNLSEFDYHLPEERIAQQPLEDRSASRMLVVHRDQGRWEDRSFRDLPEFLQAGDCLVLNDSKVFPSRLFGHRQGVRAVPVGKNNPKKWQNLTGQVEVFLLRPVSDDGLSWRALVRPGRKMRVGEEIEFAAELFVPPRGAESHSAEEPCSDLLGATTHGCSPAHGMASLSRREAEGPARSRLSAKIIEHGEFGERTVRFECGGDLHAAIDAIGHVPLPPYIHRADAASDKDRYQTIYARERGSVAAPTAGFHFTPELLEDCRESGADVAYVTLHVGLGTFQPLHAAVVEEGKLHSEVFRISEENAEKISGAMRVVAVGTTSVRSIESAARGVAGETDIFIYPGYEFQTTGAMLTNFHLPQSSLLLLVCAFGGKQLILDAYRHAVESEYRFYSYGDCMLIL